MLKLITGLRCSMTVKSYDELCKNVNEEWKLIEKPTNKDIVKIARKFKITKEEVREGIGRKDLFDFEVNLND